MMKFRSFIPLGVIICFLVSFGAANAQKSTFLKDTHIRVEAGGTLSKTSNVGLSSVALISYRAGLSASMPIYLSNFRVNTGLFITQKGEKALNGGKERAKIDPTYLVLPIDLGYRLDIDDHFSLSAGGGPYFGIGVIEATESYKKGISTSFSKDGLSNRMDIGIGLNGMLEYDNFSLKAGGEIGLTRATSDNVGAGTPRNYQIYLMLGYRLFNW